MVRRSAQTATLKAEVRNSRGTGGDGGGLGGLPGAGLTPRLTSRITKMLIGKATVHPLVNLTHGLSCGVGDCTSRDKDGGTALIEVQNSALLEAGYGRAVVGATVARMR